MRRTKEESMNTRKSVLKAAAQILVHQGMNAFTIEAVARESGMTKGGVLHHFPSKEALVNGLIDLVTEAFQLRLAAELAAESEDQPGHWLRAYIRTIFSVEFEDINLIPALAAAAVADHRIIDRIRQNVAENQMAAVRDGLHPTVATILRLAVDGVVFTRAFNLDVLDSETSRNVSKGLLSLTVPGRLHI